MKQNEESKTLLRNKWIIGQRSWVKMTEAEQTTTFCLICLPVLPTHRKGWLWFNFYVWWGHCKVLHTTRGFVFTQLQARGTHHHSGSKNKSQLFRFANVLNTNEELPRIANVTSNSEESPRIANVLNTGEELLRIANAQNKSAESSKTTNINGIGNTWPRFSHALIKYVEFNRFSETPTNTGAKSKSVTLPRESQCPEIRFRPSFTNNILFNKHYEQDVRRTTESPWVSEVLCVIKLEEMFLKWLDGRISLIRFIIPQNMNKIWSRMTHRSLLHEPHI